MFYEYKLSHRMSWSFNSNVVSDIVSPNPEIRVWVLSKKNIFFLLLCCYKKRYSCFFFQKFHKQGSNVNFLKNISLQGKRKTPHHLYLCKIIIIFTEWKLRNTIKKGNFNFIFQMLCIPISAKCFSVSTNILVTSVICICEFFQNNCTSFLSPCLCSKFCSIQCKARASVVFWIISSAKSRSDLFSFSAAFIIASSQSNLVNLWLS
jgi:hypothetical protein